jgi:diguanylate cyclase (GGDEF)-like protein
MSITVTSSVASPGTSRGYGSLSTLILGGNPQLRGTVMVSIYAAAVYAACIGLVTYFVHVGVIAPGVENWMNAGLVATIVLVYAALRSGWSTRFKDPSLTVFQIVLAIGWDCVTYALIGPAHAGMLMLMELSLFFGIFTLNARSARLVLGYTLAFAGGVMVLRANTDPVNYPPDLQFIYFVALLLVTSTIARLATSLTGMRRELEAQRRGLTTALERIQEASSRDSLTGLHNRRHMMEMLAHEVDRDHRFKTGFGLALVDLDHFKQFNDQYGHQTGDAALCCFARQAQATLRPGDVLARWGGEEFLFLYPESSPQDVLVNLELLRAKLTQTTVSDQYPDLRIRFSAGLTPFLADEPIEKTIDRADRALYRAKADGRDRCEIHLGPAP